MDLKLQMAAQHRNLDEAGQFTVNRELARIAGASIGGWSHGNHIANCMEIDRLGIPRPPEPHAQPRFKKRLGGGSRPKTK